MDDLFSAGAAMLARALRERTVSSRELIASVLERAARLDPRVNALVSIDADRALEAAGRADDALARTEVVGPLHGVPFTLKDCFLTEGLTTTAGYPPLADNVPPRDSAVAARLKAAGAILVGKTNVPPLAGDWQTFNPLFGRTANPHDPGRTSGGSSGGAAAAVAAGLSPLDIGSDLGGSIRLPAHYCGVFALKAGDGRVPRKGHIPDDGVPGGRGQTAPVSHLAAYGPLARSVEDLRLAFSAISDPPQHRPASGLKSAAEPRLLRLGVTFRIGHLAPGRSTDRMLRSLARRLADAGSVIEELPSGRIGLERAWTAWGHIAGFEAAAAGSPLTVDPERLRARIARARSGISAAYLSGLLARPRTYRSALESRREHVAVVDTLLDGLDAWILPVSVGPAFPHCETGSAIDVEGQEVDYFEAVAGFAAPINLSGHPAVVVPVGTTEDGLPLGVQLVGRRWEDERLLDVAETVASVGGVLLRPKGF